MMRVFARGVTLAAALTVFLFGLGYMPVAVAVVLWIVLAVVIRREGTA